MDQVGLERIVTFNWSYIIFEGCLGPPKYSTSSLAVAETRDSNF